MERNQGRTAHSEQRQLAIVPQKLTVIGATAAHSIVHANVYWATLSTNPVDETMKAGIQPRPTRMGTGLTVLDYLWSWNL